MRGFFPVAVTTVLAFTATSGFAEDSTSGGPDAVHGPQLAVGDRVQPDADPAGALEPSAIDRAPEATCPAPQRLTEGEIDALRKLAAENPDLAEQSGGYISNDDLLTIILILVIIWLLPL